MNSEAEGKPRILSGIKPSGELHIGNYFGAVRQLVELSQSTNYDSFIMVADYHALNTIQDPREMSRLSFELAAAYIACGLEPEQVTLFKQSAVPAHTELAWIFDTITTMPYLMRAHAFKDAEARSKEIVVGTFNYPMLMAADILLYDTNSTPVLVPVGQDQKQHIEYARVTAEKFNRIFAETFSLPKEYIMPEVAIVPGIDGQKMSKSYGNTIPLFADRETIIDRVMKIVTDSSGEKPENVYAIHNLLKSTEELKNLYEENQGKYKVLKDALVEDLDAFISPLREKYRELLQNPSVVHEALERGAARAREVSEKKMGVIRKAVGVRD